MKLRDGRPCKQDGPRVGSEHTDFVTSPFIVTFIFAGDGVFSERTLERC